MNPTNDPPNDPDPIQISNPSHTTPLQASFFNYAYEGLAVNEFHGSPLDFSFTAPIKSEVLPPLRVKGKSKRRGGGVGQQ